MGLLVSAVGVIALTVAAATGWADTVRLKSGEIVEGDVIRSDSTQVTVIVNGQPQFFSADEVAGIAYSRSRFVLSSATPARVTPVGAPVSVDFTLLQVARGRLLALRDLADRIGQILQSLQYGDHIAATQTAHVTVEEILPIRKGHFNPQYALADLLILLGLRATTIWLALLLVREPRALMRIAEFLLIAYGVTMLLMAWTLSADVFWVEVFVIPVASVVVASLFAWMFSLPLPRALIAFLLTVGMNLGVEYVLANAHLIS